MEKIMETNLDYPIFRTQYPEFIYREARLQETEDEAVFTYAFEIPGLSAFAPVWRFPKAVKDRGKILGLEHDPLLKEMVFSLGMVELVSYWKITCSSKVQIEAGRLTKEQISWWKRLYFHGLGEFFYVNRIHEADMDNFMEIDCAAGADDGEAGEGKAAAFGAGRKIVEAQAADGAGVLVPIGGGKDSAVTLELMKKAGADIWAYIINSRGATMHTAEAAGLGQEKMILVHRSLDARMLELNRKGFLNGHTPFSAIVAFSSLIAARLYGLPYIALSNESSANESTVLGSTVNHQYSKSFRFEKDFHDYTMKFLPGSGYYFSLLRPLSEFQIAGYFAGLKAYHPVFRSCNVGSKKDEWCGHCPKCLFVYVILSPFLSTEELENIFGKNMLEDKSMQPVLDQLVGLEEEKPFECVGSRKEINAALVLAIRRLKQEGRPLPKLLVHYQSTPAYQEAVGHEEEYFSYFDEEHLLPAPWAELVRRECTKKTVTEMGEYR